MASDPTRSGRQGPSGVGVIVLNWENATDTIDCLDSLSRSIGIPALEIVVCDNASTDSSVAFISEWLQERGRMVRSDSQSVAHASGARSYGFRTWAIDECQCSEGCSVTISLIEVDQNRGYAGGNNAGLWFLREQSRSDVWILLNNDVVVDSYFVRHLRERIIAEPDIGLAGCTVRYFHRPNEVQALGGGYLCRVLGRAGHVGAGLIGDAVLDVASVERMLDYPLGAGFATTRDFVERVGMLDERFFLYFEEVDWADRGRAEGFRLVYAKDAVILHKEGGSAGSSAKRSERSLLASYHMARSRSLYMLKHRPYCWPLALGYMAALSLRELIKGSVPAAVAIGRGALLLRN